MKLKIGTRASILALAQSYMIRDMLIEIDNELEVEIIKIVTSGDRDQRTNWGNKSLKSMWTKEIERAILDNEIDIAVHCMKDMPQEMPAGLKLLATPKGEDNRDVFLSNSGKGLMDIKSGSIIGTSSLRRQENIKNLRSDLIVKPIRGNIHTRIEKMKSGEFDAIVLAAAGLIRTDMTDQIVEYLDRDQFLPAPAQGILCIQGREDDKEVEDLIIQINDEETSYRTLAERQFSKIFDGGCTTPMGCTTEVKDGYIYMKGAYVHQGRMYRDEGSGKVEDAEKVARDIALSIKESIV